MITIISQSESRTFHTRAMVIGLLKSFPPCIRKPHGVVESWRSSLASNVKIDILHRLLYTYITISTSLAESKTPETFYFLINCQLLHTALQRNLCGQTLNTIKAS